MVLEDRSQILAVRSPALRPTICHVGLNALTVAIGQQRPTDSIMLFNIAKGWGGRHSPRSQEVGSGVPAAAEYFSPMALEDVDL